MKERTLEAKAVRYGKHVAEWDTHEVVKLEGEWFLLTRPWGKSGYRDKTETSCRPLSQSEAHAYLLEFGAVEVVERGE